jgi:hypothetical protein
MAKDVPANRQILRKARRVFIADMTEAPEWCGCIEADNCIEADKEAGYSWFASGILVELLENHQFIPIISFYEKLSGEKIHASGGYKRTPELSDRSQTVAQPDDPLLV